MNCDRTKPHWIARDRLGQEWHLPNDAKLARYENYAVFVKSDNHKEEYVTFYAPAVLLWVEPEIEAKRCPECGQKIVKAGEKLMCVACRWEGVSE